MTNDAPIAPGWFPDEQFGNQERWWDGRAWTEHVRPKGSGAGAVQPATSAARGQAYVVLQVVLKERLLGTGSGNLTQLEGVINEQAARGYRLHTITTTTSGSKGIGGGDRIQATMVFERL